MPGRPPKKLVPGRPPKEDDRGRARRSRRLARRFLLVPVLSFLMMIVAPIMVVGSLGVPEEVVAVVNAGRSAWSTIKSAWSSATGSVGGRGGGGPAAVGSIAPDAGIPFAEVFNSTAAQGIDPRLVAAVAWQESDHFAPDVIDCRRLSDAGAMGIMQFMPPTARELRVDPCDPVQAIPSGAQYLMQLYRRFGAWDLALAGYNAGPDEVERHGGIPPFRQTQLYVPAVLAKWEEYRRTFPDAVMAGTSTGSEPQRAEILARAQTWIDLGGVPYSMSAFHDGWRTDCSGYVSMAWGLAQPGATTVTLASTHAVQIDRASLQPGDILLDDDPGSSGHVVLFERWDADTNYYWGYEQAAGAGGTVHRRIPYPYFGGNADFVPYRSRTLA